VIQPSGAPTPDLRPLDASLFSFHEYGSDDLRRVKQALGGVSIRAGNPNVAVVDGGVFVPSEPNGGRQGTEKRTRQPVPAGILGPDGRSVTAANLHRAKRMPIGLAEPAAVAPADSIDEEVVYLGWLFDSYGHFLLESLARTWGLAGVDTSVRVVFHIHDRTRRFPESWALRILAAFGIPQERILLPAVTTRFRRIIVPEPLFEMHRAVHEQAGAPYKTVASNIAGGTKPSSQPVYLSRRLLAGSRRQLIGEAELEDVLRENGFLVAHPETMTFEDQVRLVNAHTDIFSSTGSAAHNILFALHRPRLHLLTSGASAYRSFFLCSASAGAPTAFVNCLDTGARSAEDYQRWLPEVVAMPSVVDYLDTIGLLRTRRRAALAGRDPAHKRAYDEAWFYATIGADVRGVAPLSDAVEREAIACASCSWPVSLALAQYYARRDATRFDAMVKQLAELAAAEFDSSRLAHYRADVERVAAIAVKRGEPATASLAIQLVLDKFRPDYKGRSYDLEARLGSASA
jgi:capsular polysaccharide biosynthesis protein